MSPREPSVSAGQNTGMLFWNKGQRDGTVSDIHLPLDETYTCTTHSHTHAHTHIHTHTMCTYIHIAQPPLMYAVTETFKH